MKNLTILFLGLFLFACGSENSDSDSAENSKKDEVVEERLPSYSINADEGGVIRTDHGSVITIPAGAFVDSDGKPVKGEVQILFDEYHDFADIAMSGISMFYDSAGVTNDLKSAGMFEIDGKQNGEKIHVAEGKKLNVDLASLEDTPCYNFYKQDEESKQWNYSHTDNGKREDSLMANKLPNNPSNQELSNALSIDIDYTNIPELKMYRSLIWRYVGEKIPEMLTRINWKTAKITPVEGEDMVYNLNMNQNGKEFNWKITPIYTGKDLVKAMGKYESSINKMKADPNSIYYRPKMIRSVAIEGFGTYNWDIINKRDESQVDFPVLATVDGEVPTEMNVSLICLGEDIVVNYTKETLDKFSFDPKSRNVMVAIYDGGKVALLHPSKFKFLNQYKGKTEAVTVDLKSQGDKIYSREDLRELISGLVKA